MENTRIVIVDDSPFSVSIITDILIKNGFNVVGSAGSLEEVKEVVEKLKPNLVTMDMVLSDSDGFECTKAVHEVDPNIKVIAVSSMMDDEIMKKAKKNNISAYVQKPVEEADLILAVKRVLSGDELFIELKNEYYDIFKQAFSYAFNKFIKEVPSFEENDGSKMGHLENGISVVMGIIGKYTGRLIINVSYENANKFAKLLLKRDCKNFQESLNVLGEFSNIIAGNACSMLNRENRVFGMRVAPPTIIYGESINISKNKLDTIKFLTVNTECMEINMSIGFSKGAVEWMSNI
ncbi:MULTISPECIES: response regulator [Clostridium]|uniref:response regulator n=1 Tax=Clostridium TaxID=1485 RepID=UPI0008259192|nr:MULTISPECIES: response regulator [Clostridium]PJI07769.1 two-component system response regulator [Clostridium sp. CT7]